MFLCWLEITKNRNCFSISVKIVENSGLLEVTSVKLYVNFDNFRSFFSSYYKIKRPKNWHVFIVIGSMASKEAKCKRETMYFCIAFCEQLNIVTIIFDFVRFQWLSMELVLAIVSPSKSIQFRFQSHNHSCTVADNPIICNAIIGMMNGWM